MNSSLCLLKWWFEIVWGHFLYINFHIGDNIPVEDEEDEGVMMYIDTEKPLDLIPIYTSVYVLHFLDNIQDKSGLNGHFLLMNYQSGRKNLDIYCTQDYLSTCKKMCQVTQV